MGMTCITDVGKFSGNHYLDLPFLFGLLVRWSMMAMTALSSRRTVLASVSYSPRDLRLRYSSLSSSLKVGVLSMKSPSFLVYSPVEEHSKNFRKVIHR